MSAKEHTLLTLRYDSYEASPSKGSTKMNIKINQTMVVAPSDINAHDIRCIYIRYIAFKRVDDFFKKKKCKIEHLQETHKMPNLKDNLHQEMETTTVVLEDLH